MATTSPPSSRPAKVKSAEPSSLPIGAILYGALFIILATLILTRTIKPRPIAVTQTKAIQPTTLTLPLAYPPARIVDVSDAYFGVKVADPYRWLEDGKSTEVQDWVTAENKLARRYLDMLPGRDALKERFQQLFHIDTISVPERAGDRLFYMKRKSTDEKAILYWRPVDDPKSEHVLVDPNQFVATNNAALGEWVPTLDGKRLAYTLRPNNADEATLYVKDVETGKDLPDEVIEGAKYASVSWMPDGSGFVYTYLPPADPDHPEDRPGLAEIRYHKLGADPKKDPVLHEKTGDATQFIDASVSRDGKWLIYDQGNWAKNDVYYQPLQDSPSADLAGSWKPLVEGKNFLYSVYPWKGQAYILTNENAERYHLFKVSLSDPRRARWHEIVPESPSIVLKGMAVIGDHLVLDELKNVSSQVEIRDLNGKAIRSLVLPGLGSVEVEGEPDHDEIYYSFVNFTTPPEIFEASVVNPTQALWARVNVPVDPSPYVVEQKFFPSKDGTSIPMFIVHRRDILLDGSTPFLLTGYGGFGISETPYFSSGIYPWLEAGGGYAVANLRGGGEFGEKWHQDGMLLKKQNVFDDCIAAAEYLVAQGYTKPERLAFRGGSNGGLLAGALLTQRPDLFRAIVCEVPLLDMVRYDQFESGKTWVPEYGSPQDPAQIKALYAYSPYHHVAPGTRYPSVLFWSDQNDDRVDPMHARKMAAALQAATGSTNPILLRVETQGGHGGGDQVKKTIDRGTDIWSFLLHELGAQTPEKAQDQNTGH